MAESQGNKGEYMCMYVTYVYVCNTFKFKRHVHSAQMAESQGNKRVLHTYTYVLHTYKYVLHTYTYVLHTYTYITAEKKKWCLVCV